jgi:ketosteroid isomerase-like protein
MSVSTLQGNEWKLSADTWNMMPPPAATTTAQTDLEGVKAASQAFYSALNARDATAMAKVYAHTPFVAYIPPVGSDVAVGWEAVNKTWEDVFTKVTKQINRSYKREGGPQIDGNTAWEVGIEKGPVTFADGKTADFGVLSTNIYQKIDGRWQMISHQAGQIPPK